MILVWVKGYGWSILDTVTGLIYSWGPDEAAARALHQPYRHLWDHPTG